MEKLLKKHADKFRFAVIGALNTVIDFVILFVLVAFGLPAIASNFISTSTALIFSFFANKTFTFKIAESTKRHFIYFLIITLFGLWVIQPIIIVGVNMLLDPWFTEICFVKLVGELLGSWFKASYLVLLIGKVLATAVTLIWNYLLYRKFVFVKQI